MMHTNRLQVAVLVSGSGTNLQAIIDQMHADELDILITGVISDRPTAKALDRADAAGIPTVALDYKAFGSRGDFDTRLDMELEKLDADLVVLAGYMRILASSTVLRYAGRMLNIHPSLLPKYPGLDTYRRVLEAGDAWHGTTVHYVIPQLDSGPPILQYRVHVQAEDTELSLQQRVQQGEYLIYPRVIGWIAQGRLRLEHGKVVKDGKPLERPLVVDEKRATDLEALD